MPANDLQKQILDYFQKKNVPGAAPDELPGHDLPGFQNALRQLERKGVLELVVAKDIIGAGPTVVMVMFTGRPSSR